MGRVAISADNRPAESSSFPKLKLDKGEFARIVCLEAPEASWTHTLRAPRVVNGKPVYEKVRSDDGNETEQMVMDFVGQPLCLGDEDVLTAAGIDPDNCPACKRSMEAPDEVYKPRVRYSMNVIKYKVKSGTHQVATPFSVECVVWSFTQSMFAKLCDYAAEYGDLRAHDLLLGPCTNKNYQKFDIMPSGTAAWLESDDRKMLTVETFNSNKVEDLAACNGRRSDRRWVEADVERVAERWAVVSRASGPATGGGDTSALLAGFQALLAGSGSVPQAAPPPPPVQPQDQLAALLGGLAPQAAPPAPAPAPEPAPAPAAQTTAADLSALLGGGPVAAPPAAPAQQAAPDMAALLAQAQAAAPETPSEAPATPAPPAATPAPTDFSALLASQQPSQPTTATSLDDLTKLLGG